MQVPVPSQSNQPIVASIGQVESLGADALLRNDLSDSYKAAALRNQIDKVIAQNEAQGVSVTGVNVFDMQTNRMLVQRNESSVQFAASVNKLPIAWLILQDLRANKITLNDTVTWTAADVRAGYGIYDQPGAATSATVQQLLHDMLNYSGNTAVRALVNGKLGGAAAVNTRLAAYPQIPNTRLQPLDANRFYVGNSTSKESLWVMEKLLAKSDKYQKVVKEALQTNIFSYYGVRSQLEGNGFIVLANKVGILDDVDGNNRHDVGIIYNTKTHKAYGYSFMTTTPYGNTAGTSQAEHSLDLMGRDTLRFAGDRPLKNKQISPFGIAPQAKSSANAGVETKVLY